MPGRDSADDQPNQYDDRSESHVYLRMSGGSRASGGPRLQVAPSSTPQAADTPAERDREAAQAGYAANAAMRDTWATAADLADP
ncbi:MAG TPA: hypothetical protein VIX15_19335, partial [Streptosporangiaceae bacterium]